MRNKVVIVDYGSGNLFSLTQALETVGGEVIQSSDPDLISSASRLVIPGVGSFGQCISQLRTKGLDKAVRDYVLRGRPVLGICVGMHILFEIGEEFGEHVGLGLIPGRVVAIPSLSIEHKPLKRPHIAWAPLETAEGCTWHGSILEPIKEKSCMYFAHSYYSLPTALGCCIAEISYGGHSLCAVVLIENLIGCQFHPEKSGSKGLTILQHFISQ